MIRMLRATLLGMISLGLTVAGPPTLAQVATSQGAETTAERDARMQWWRDAKFGMFIHWGVYAVPAGTYAGEQISGIGEWIQLHGKIPVATYRQYAKDFNPTKYDPAAWADLAATAGMKYVVITSKHHDGFALYDSKVTEWDIAGATPYGKDLLAPLAEAVRQRDMKFGLYYSQAQDWVHPGGAKWGFEDGEGWDDAHKGSFDEYLRSIALPQTEEILTRYRPDVLWWDTPRLMTPERARPFHALAMRQTGIITNNRLGGGYAGDTETPEQYIPARGYKSRDWETCMTMNDTWGFKSYDHNWKSTEVLLHNLIDIVSKGGNYLLNVGPTAQGEIPQESIDRLKEVGKWMAANGESIYGTIASPCRIPAWGRITQRKEGGRLYLHVFEWPTGGELVVPIQAKVLGCRLLVDPAREFATRSTEEGIAIELTGQAPDPIASVVVLEVEGPVEEVFQRISPSSDGRLALAAASAQLEGSLKVETIGEELNLGFWTNPSDTATWYCRLPTAGKYTVSAELAAPLPTRLELRTGQATLDGRVSQTGSYQKFATQELGTLEIAQPGDLEISLVPDRQGWHAINLRRLVLEPVAE